MCRYYVFCKCLQKEVKVGKWYIYIQKLFELRTPVNTNFEKGCFWQDTNMRIPAIIRIYMLAANFYRDSPMLGSQSSFSFFNSL